MAGPVTAAPAPPTDYSLLARLVLASFMVVDAADYPYRLITGPVPEDAWASGLHRLVGLVACLSLLWGWRRTLVVSAAATIGFVVVREQITGFELWWLPIALALSVSRRWWPAVAVVVALGAALAGWTYAGHGSAAAVGVTALLVLGLVAGVVLGLVSAQRATVRARVEELRVENARLRQAERRLLAGDLRSATEHLFSDARRESAASLTSTDPEALHRALAVVRDDARAALASLRQLLEVLHAVEADGGRPDAEPDDRAGTLVRTSRSAAAISLLGLAVASAVGAALSDDRGEHQWLLAVALAGAALTCLQPVPGALVGVVMLVATLALHATAWVVLVAVASIVIATALGPWQGARLGVIRVLGATVVLGHTVARAAIGGPGTLNDMAAVAAGALGGSLVALAADDYRHVVRRSRADRDLLASEREGIGRGERASLARDLHDQLGHQLSLIALQVSAVEGDDDPARLRQALTRIDASLATAAEELAALLEVMAAAPATSSAPGPLMTPTVVGAVMAEKLREHGHDASFAIDPAADLLDATTRLTLVRVLQEATTNVLRHAAPQAPTRSRLCVDDAQASLTVVNAVPTASQPGRLAHLSGGHGLRGIRERVDVSGGTFDAGVVGRDWVLTVVLPVDSEMVVPGSGRPRR